MELVRGLHNLHAERHKHGSVLTVGNFDGVHRGHRAVLAQLTEVAAVAGVPSWLLTFEPHPREFFGAAAPPRLTRLREKLAVLQTTALDYVLCVHFNRTFASLTPHAFIKQLLVERLSVQALIVGDDFRFGRGGSGDVALLKTAGRRYGFRTIDCATLTYNGRRVSSSWVREALADGRLELAAELLGRPYRMAGRVAHGERIGRGIGFPTANVTLGRRAVALAGVFAVWLHGLAEGPRPGVANVGARPTVGGRENRLEVHLLDYDGDLYGLPVEVEFLRRLRPERRFDSLAALQAQIKRDVAQARAVFEGR